MTYETIIEKIKAQHPWHDVLIDYIVESWDEKESSKIILDEVNGVRHTVAGRLLQNIINSQ